MLGSRANCAAAHRHASGPTTSCTPASACTVPHVLVEVERGDDDHGQRVGDPGAGERACGLDAVKAGHPDVEQAHVRAQAPGELDRLQPDRVSGELS